MKIQISSAIAIRGKIIKAGETVDVEKALALNLIRRGKAEEVAEAPTKAAAPKTPRKDGADAPGQEKN